MRGGNTPDKDHLELSHRLVVVLDQLGELADATAYVDTGGRVGYLKFLEKLRKALIGLVPRWNVPDGEGASIKRFCVFW
jgi:hypothetical protein